MAYLIEKFLPEQEVSLVAGPSGAGKTTWLFGMLAEWEQGHDVLGYQSHPVPWVYVAADRSIASVQRTLASMSVPGPRDIIPAWDKQMSYAQILDAVQASKAKLAVIEAFGSFVEPPANSACVKAFLSAASHGIRSHGLTVLGVVESPKQKPFEKYDNPRQRVSGAASWGHFCETIFLVEHLEVKDPRDPRRILYVCPRQGPGLRLEGAFDANNRLIFTP